MHPYHVPIIVVMSVAVGLALVATGIVLAGFFTNWFAAPSSDTDATNTTDATDGTTDKEVPVKEDDSSEEFVFPSALIMSGVTSQSGSALDQGGTFELSTGTKTFTKGSSSITDALAIWTQDSLKIFVAPNNGYASNTDKYYWGIANSVDYVTSHTTSDTLDVSQLSNSWKGTFASVTLEAA